jgi:hypothetical protein
VKTFDGVTEATGLTVLRHGDVRLMFEERKRRIGKNEGKTRAVNDMVRPLDRNWMTILCECGEAGCRDHVVIAQDEYARIREEPTLFVLRPGHEAADTERVVAKHVEFWIVQKRPGLPAEIARATGSTPAERCQTPFSTPSA